MLETGVRHCVNRSAPPVDRGLRRSRDDCSILEFLKKAIDSLRGRSGDRPWKHVSQARSEATGVSSPFTENEQNRWDGVPPTTYRSNTAPGACICAFARLLDQFLTTFLAVELLYVWHIYWQFSSDACGALETKLWVDPPSLVG